MIRLLFYLFIVFFLLIQLFTLAYSPLPWFDETYFASIALSFIQTGRLIPQVALFEEIKFYGFVYFLLTGLSFHLFGFGIFQFRLINLLFGLGCIWLITKITKSFFDKQKAYFIYLPWLIVLDPFFYLCLHEGRMDLTALFLMLLAILWMQKSFKNNKMYAFALSGFFASLSLLTTPRIGFILIPLTFVLLYYWLKNPNQNTLHFIVWFFVLLFSYYCWIFFAFEGFIDFIQSYTLPGPNLIPGNSVIDLFIGWNGYIPRQEYLLIFCATISIFYGIYSLRFSYFQPLILIALFSIILFYVLVFDYGPYSIMLIPFYYLLIFKALSIKKVNYTNPILYLVFLLWVYNSSYFILKNIQVFASVQQRDFHSADLFIQKNIPKGSKVIGEPLYFYSVLKNGSDFQYMNLYEEMEQREKRQREVYRYDFMIISGHLVENDKETVNYYTKNAKLKLIAELKILPSELSKKMDALNLLSKVEKSGYDCRIYQIIR